MEILEGNFTYENTSPKGEPHLGKRGLYGATGGDKNAAANIMTMLWVLNLSDGRHSLLDIAGRADLPFRAVADVAALLAKNDLLRRV